MKRYMCTECELKQKIRDGRIEVRYFAGIKSKLYARCARCKKQVEVKSLS